MAFTLALYAYPGGLVWVFCFVSIGYSVGAEWPKLVGLLDRGALVLVAIAVVVALVVWWLRHEKRAV